MRHHPFREEGGVFIYPSMHFVLSRHKYLYPLEPEETRGGIPPCFDELKMMLKGTFHPGRCVAFVGGHGTHKSRLAFIQVLFTLSQLPNASALIISLGEDEVSTARNLEEIARDQFPSKALNVKDLIASGRLEIAYYPPGFITPEEFFHRLQLSIARHRAGSLNRNTVLVAFNSLNLLHSHFPLCAEHKVFIPAVVELLGHEGVTSFFVSGGSASDDVYGLLSLADPILEFERVDCKKQYVFEHVLPKDVDTTNLIMCPDEFSLVKVSVARFAGGTSAGAHGFLGLVTSDDVLGHVVQRGLRLWLPR
jgi:hypothetical protein